MRDRRTDGVSGRPSLCKVGRSQSAANPISFNLSGPLKHRTPSSRLSDEILRAVTVAAVAIPLLGGRRETIANPLISLHVLCLTKRARYACHWRGISQELHAGVASKTGDQEEAAAALGDSEILSIKHPSASQITAFGKGPDHVFKVSAIVDSEQPRDVFNDHPLRPELPDDAHPFPEEAAALSGEAGASPVAAGVAHDADVLAGEAEGDAIDGPEVPGADVAHVAKLASSGKSVSEGSPIFKVQFDLPDALPAGALEAEIESADAGKEASVGESMRHRGLKRAVV